eukprot:COSAG06_NODE_43981_length_367_cov_0.768657_1_plen_40_part_10
MELIESHDLKSNGMETRTAAEFRALAVRRETFSVVPLHTN